MAFYTTSEPAQMYAKIFQPSLAITGTPIEDSISCLYELTTSFVATTESISIEDRIYDAYDFCEEDYKRVDKSVESYLEETDRLIRLRLHYALDKKTMAAAIAAAGTTIAAVTDSATAKAALDTVRDIFTGKTNMQNEITAVIPSTLMKYFIDIMASRVTVMGDSALLTGSVNTIDGINLVAAASGQLADPTKVVFFVGKPVNYYFDKNGMNLETYNAVVPTGKAINKNFTRLIELQGQVVVWYGNAGRIIVSG
jgi:hypothetical protein